MMASNENYVVPATSGERRYAVFNVSNAKAQDPEWFGPIYAELANGGKEAMIHDLLAMDLSDFHPRQVPQTEALLEQQEEGLPPLESWWREILESGCVPGSTKHEPDFSFSQVLLKSAKESSPKLRDYLSLKQLGRFFAEKGCATIKRNNQLRGPKFRPLSDMRKDWEKRYPGTTWEDPDLTDWWPDLPDLDQHPKSFIDLLKSGKLEG